MLYSRRNVKSFYKEIYFLCHNTKSHTLELMFYLPFFIFYLSFLFKLVVCKEKGNENPKKKEEK